MATSSHLITSGQAKQIRLIGLILLPVLALLAAGYFLFLRTDYAPLASGLRPAEANAIVAELKKQEIPYRLASGGGTILVPAGQADELRLAVQSGSVSEPGSVGFELFNESDMGLTDFAQKINYQRALQGELARTIMEMDGIAHARVHLALPERSLFRASRSEARAAVTIIPKPGILIDEQRVEGIRRLVASTVTDLKIENVAVLNQRGELMTAQPISAPDRMAAATKLERAYAERIGGAISTVAPDLNFDVKVTTSPSVPDGEDGAVPDLKSANQRNYAVRIELFTPRPVPASLQAGLEQAITRSVGVTAAAGDDVQFLIEPQVPAPALVPPSAVEAAASRQPDPSPAAMLNGNIIALAALGAMAIAGFMMLLAVRRRRLVHREELYVRLRDQLLIEQSV
ncbi:flagellar basal-body MS-ring/collar protein FliF [Sphingomonas sp.]|uniref:flagellar basal-body MS-ring/collar protein FliF n=1 Tax=Sphingomonas sp. TaxID=28214 RepID=UPI0025FE6239|nr:flagellar basal-body MS-ring/collar protein FliF [Sphingomonas sp.]